MNSPVSLDKELNFNVDGIYFGETYYSGSLKGKAYKIAIPWDWSDTNTYVDDPNDASNPWSLAPLYDCTRPITAPMALSLDRYDNIWVYFGTGRYIGQADKTYDDTQYLFGLVDPFFNEYYDTAPDDYYHNYTKSLELDVGDLFLADPYVVTTAGSVFNGTNYFGSWNTLRAAAGQTDGWYRTLTTTGERCITKPSVLGGIVSIPSFTPNDDVCGFGGDSDLYGLYYETGTPFYKPLFLSGTESVNLDGNDYDKVLEKLHLGAGKSSALGIHAGQEDGAKAFIQQSTGIVLEAHLDPAFRINSGLIHWRLQ